MATLLHLNGQRYFQKLLGEIKTEQEHAIGISVGGTSQESGPVKSVSGK